MGSTQISYNKIMDGLWVVVWLQQRRNRLFDMTACLLHVVGHPLFLLLPLAVIYRYVDAALGLRLLIDMWLTVAIVMVIKLLLRLPRPHQAHPDQVQALVYQPGYGLPSGHVAIAVLLVMVIVQWAGGLWLWWVVGAVYVFVMGWARMYVGVHYPQDIITGLVIGPAIVLLF